MREKKNVLKYSYSEARELLKKAMYDPTDITTQFLKDDEVDLRPKKELFHALGSNNTLKQIRTKLDYENAKI